ncbi:hypothetical protein IFM89_008108 [Coptis chinensis]|uniref:Uncharacterized protein n=1 Tax=Coptis chinensis TaxID=261450 RepID=A0A835IS96_9MAGN|nr:hypothetical protein IFM89_008108 [Coptis chinensis]
MELNSFPSIQSGTWSALMQSAVAEASSSETGLQDEWSGLSFHQRELSTGDQPSAQGDGAKQQTDWADSNLQSAASLTSRPFPLFDDGKMSQNGRNVSVFQKSGTRNFYEENERMQNDASYESVQQSLKGSANWLDHSPQQNSFIQGSHQVQPSLNSENAFPSARTRLVHSESAAHATKAGFDTQNMQGSWVNQHGTSSRNIDSPNNHNTNRWNNNNSLPVSGAATFRISEGENCAQRFQRNDLKMGIDQDGGIATTNSFPNFNDGGGNHQVNREASFMNNCNTIPNSSTTKGFQETNQQILNSPQLNYRKHMVDPPMNHRGGDSIGYNLHHSGYNQQPMGSQVHESSMYNSDRGSGDTHDKKRENCYQKEFSNDSYNSNQSQPTVTGGGLRENSWLSTSDSRPLASANQKSTGQVGHKVPMPRRFQYHPMGNMEVDLETTDTLKRVAHLQASSHQGFQGSKGHEREYFGHSNFNTNASNLAIGMEKEHIPDSQGTERGSASSDGSAGTFPQSRRTVQTCQNMLELFHKVDHSAEHGTAAGLSSSDRHPSSAMPEAEGSDASIGHQWHNQSTASQGYGLRLAPPSQRLPVTKHVLNSQNSSQVVNSLNSSQVDSNAEEEKQRWLAAASSLHPLPQEISQRENWENNPNVSRQTGNETSQSNMQANISGAFPSTLPYSRNQLQSQQISRDGEKAMSTPPVNVLNDRPPHFRQTHGIQGEVVADQSSQVSLAGPSSRTSFTPPEDTSQPNGPSWSQVRISGQQLPVLESVPVSRPSALTGKSQQGDFSSMLHHAWANVSAQAHSTGGTLHRVPPNFSQSSQSNSNLEKTSQQLEYGDTKNSGKVPDFGGCSTNSQPVRESSWQQMPAEKVDPTPQNRGASQGQESVVKHPLDTKYRKDPALVSQRENLSSRNPATSTRDIEAFGRSLRQTHQNYSLLHQVQAMKSMENDLDKRSGKRFKGADGDSDAQQLANRTGHQLHDSGTNVAVQHTSFSSGDRKMLSFSSEGREHQNRNAASQSVHGVVPSRDMATFGRIETYNRSSELNAPAIRSENPQINPKMAPSWFDRYGTFRTEQILPMQDTQSKVKPSAQQFIFDKGPEGLHALRSIENVNAVDSNQIDSISQSTVSTIVQSEHLTPLQSMPTEVTDQTLAVVRPRKRKTETSMLIPWHKQIVHGSQRLQTISIAEQDWALTANRLVEKVEEEPESADDGQSVIRPKRRLIYTTQLMQQVLRPAPAEFLSAKAISGYEAVTYSVSKSALGEACSLISSSYSAVVDENRESGKSKTSDEKEGDQHIVRVVEDFIGRAKKLETDLLRFDKRASVMDIRVECQDLERFSVINRFAKFHGRSQADAAETSTSSSAAAAITQKTCPQRYVTAHAMPRNLPAGVQCLSL